MRGFVSNSSVGVYFVVIVNNIFLSHETNSYQYNTKNVMFIVDAPSMEIWTNHTLKDFSENAKLSKTQHLSFIVANSPYKKGKKKSVYWCTLTSLALYYFDVTFRRYFQPRLTGLFLILSQECHQFSYHFILKFTILSTKKFVWQFL